MKQLRLLHKHIKAHFKTLRLILGHKLLNYIPTTPPISVVHITNINSILFMRYDGKIGDYIVSSFIFREIKKANPSVEISVISDDKHCELYQNNPHITHVHVINGRNLSKFIQLSRSLKKEHFDIIVDLNTILRNRELLLLKTLNASYRIGNGYNNSSFFDYCVQSDVHTSNSYAEILTHLSITTPSLEYDIPHNAQCCDDIQAFLHKNNLANYIVVNFFGASSSRSFSFNRQREILNTITTYSAQPIVLLTYPAVTKKLQQLIESRTNIYLFPQTTSIYHSIEIIKQATLVISPDTSIIHIAAGLHKKIIGCYSNDIKNNIRWAPFAAQKDYRQIYFEKHVDNISLKYFQKAFNELF